MSCGLTSDRDTWIEGGTARILVCDSRGSRRRIWGSGTAMSVPTGEIPALQGSLHDIPVPATGLFVSARTGELTAHADDFLEIWKWPKSIRYDRIFKKI